MNRRKFIISSAVGTSSLMLGAGLALRATAPASHTVELPSVITRLNALLDTPFKSIGKWNAAHIFEHCKQSVDYSITGYPEVHSELFQNTAGVIAFETFGLARRMQHPLDEVIPSAPDLAMDNERLALQQLISSLETFQSHIGPLKPHFAFGELNKSDYAFAHAVHINQHLEEIYVHSA